MKSKSTPDGWHHKFKVQFVSNHREILKVFPFAKDSLWFSKRLIKERNQFWRTKTKFVTSDFSLEITFICCQDGRFRIYSYAPFLNLG